MSLADLGGWPAVLGALARREHLSAEQAHAAMSEILAGAATSAQIAAFCVALRIKGETVTEVGGLLSAMMDHAQRVSLPAGMDAIDTCGTGGDRRGTLNASTVAAMVVAGAGVPVCKHGNRALSSSCGSADVLDALGVHIDLGPEGVVACLGAASMAFCFAPRYHPALRHAGPTRRELGIPTAFNFLGPLANPAGVRRQALGVSDPAMAERMLGVLAAAGTERALVFYGHDGLDELSTVTTSTVLELRDGGVHTWTVDPGSLGLRPAGHDDLRGGDAATNAGIARRILDGDPGPQREFVLLNAAAGLMAAGFVEDLANGLEAAAESVDSGRASQVLDRLVTVSAEQSTGLQQGNP